LEYEGRAWRRHKKKQEAELVKLRRKAERGEIDAEQAKRERGQIDADLRAGSRLFAVDVGSDPQMLRSQYPDGGRYIIAPALVRLSYRSEGRQRRPYGIVDSVLVDRLHVPRSLAEPLLALPEEGRLYRGYVYYQRGKTLAPRYSVQVRWGRGFEPWIAGVQLLKGD
ncbi:MAG: DUF4824 family protein, partial [Desulfuromonadales bacterium]|nr:DUF4824 family protein [Desulfuromonadales bacterium]NIS41480.1 DUF4824 family protein [Desulfuromonadales bacterium]